MGDIADGMINGDFDCYTGEYIGSGYGFPRTRNGSLPWEKGNNKAPANGVLAFLHKKGIKNTDEIVLMLQQYCEYRKWEIQGKKFIKKVAIKIQEDWPSFASWAGNKIANAKKY